MVVCVETPSGGVVTKNESIQRSYHVISGAPVNVCLPPTNRFASETYTNRIITMGAKYVLHPHIFLHQETPQSRDLNALSSPLFLSIICIMVVPFLIIREMFKPIDQRTAPAGKQWRLHPDLEASPYLVACFNSTRLVVIQLNSFNRSLYIF